MTEDETKKFYKELLDKYGMGPQVVGWGSVDSQRIRFEILLNIIKEKKGNVSLLDVGCGTCDLYEYIIEKYDNTKLNIDYYGIDLSSDMVCEARKAHCIERNRVRTSSLKNYKPGRRFDYVVASGIFSHSNYTEVNRSILYMYSLADKGFAFNCLRKGYKGERKTDGEFYANHHHILGLARSIFDNDYMTSWMMVDYLPNDFTVFVRIRDV